MDCSCTGTTFYFYIILHYFILLPVELNALELVNIGPFILHGIVRFICFIWCDCLKEVNCYGVSDGCCSYMVATGRGPRAPKYLESAMLPDINYQQTVSTKISNLKKKLALFDLETVGCYDFPFFYCTMKKTTLLTSKYV